MQERHAALPIPVPRHLIYRAIHKERAGRWKISSAPAANGSSTLYSVESYAPPVKPSKLQARLRAQRPRFDNLAEDSAFCLESPKAQTLRVAAATAASGNVPKKTVRTLAPQMDRGRCSLTRVLSEVGRGKAPPAAALEQPRPKPPVKCKSKKILSTAAVRKKQLTEKAKAKAPTKQPSGHGASKTDVKRKYSNNKKYKIKS